LKVYWVTAPYINPVAGCEPITGIIRKKLFFAGLTTSSESFFLKRSKMVSVGHILMLSAAGTSVWSAALPQKSSIKPKTIQAAHLLFIIYCIPPVLHFSNVRKNNTEPAIL